MENGKLRKSAEKKVDRALKSGVYLKSAKREIPTKVPDEPKKDVVPVRIDAKTVAYVRRDKCEFVNGEWKRRQ